MKIHILKFTILLLIMAGGFVSCKEKESKDRHDLISSNLSKNGSIDPAFLIGEWELIKFSYTEDGKRISDVKTISRVSDVSLSYNIVKIRDDDPTQYIIDAPSGVSGPWIFANNYLFYSISGNLISFAKLSGSVWAIDIHMTDEGFDILNALTNAYSFVIKDNELIIYFTGIDNKNLLILKNIKP